MLKTTIITIIEASMVHKCDFFNILEEIITQIKEKSN